MECFDDILAVSAFRRIGSPGDNRDRTAACASARLWPLDCSGRVVFRPGSRRTFFDAQCSEALCPGLVQALRIIQPAMGAPLGCDYRSTYTGHCGFVYSFPPAPSPSNAVRMVIAGIVYVGAALGLEIFTGWWVGEQTRDNWTHSALVVVEETGEMIGAITFLDVFLAYTERELGSRARFGSLVLQLETPEKSAIRLGTQG